ncbi:MAG: hypothetical protein IIX89_04205 [Oscillospiraceae bacterium]|nr:hypothetical protein [Oscillospiraceae bacterium]MBQ5815924.1 hypothetical protein [Oscillospiraceae bacterium]
MSKGKKVQSSCELCAYYYYDDEDECYVCGANLDEDEMAGFLLHRRRDCPFFRFGDEYAIVRKQN